MEFRFIEFNYQRYARGPTPRVGSDGEDGEG